VRAFAGDSTITRRLLPPAVLRARFVEVLLRFLEALFLVVVFVVAIDSVHR
jgi:hypothetical protein